MATSLHPFPEFELYPRETLVPAQFTKWVQHLERLFMAMDIADANLKHAMLLHYMGEGVDDIFQTLVMPADPESEQAQVCMTRQWHL